MFKVRFIRSDGSAPAHTFGSTYALDKTFAQAWDMFADPEYDRFDRFEVVDEAGQVVRDGARPKV